MYSKQLEQLIQSVIADGVVTDKERAVLHKKAAAEGVDENEIDVYVDGLIARNTRKDPPKKQYDLSVFDKANKNGGTYYRFKEDYYAEETNPDLSLIYNLYVSFVDLVSCPESMDNEDTPALGMKILLSYDIKDSAFINNFTIETKSNKIQLTDRFQKWENVIAPIAYCKNRRAYTIDAEQLKMLADAKPPIRIIAHYSNWSDDFYCNDLPVYAQCFYRELVDKNAYPNAKIVGDNREDSVDDAYDDSQNDGTENLNGVTRELVANLLSTKPKLLEKTDVNYPLIKQYVGVDDIVVTHISGHMQISMGQQFPYLRLHALSHPENGITFYFGYIYDGSAETLSALKIRVNMRDYTLKPLVGADYQFNRGYVIGDNTKFNFFRIDETLLEQLMTTKVGIVFPESSGNNDTGRKLPTKWQKAFTLLTDSKKFEQWKQTEEKYKKEHPVLYFFRSLFS